MRAYLKANPDLVASLKTPAKLVLSMIFLFLPTGLPHSGWFPDWSLPPGAITFTLFIYFLRAYCIDIGVKSTNWLLESMGGLMLMSLSSLAIVNLAPYEKPLWDLAGIPTVLLGAGFFYVWRVMCTDVDKFRFGLSGIFVVAILNAYYLSSETTSMFLFATSTLPITFGLHFLYLGWGIELLTVIGSTLWRIASSFGTRIKLAKEITPDATFS